MARTISARGAVPASINLVDMLGSLMFENSKDAWHSFPYGFRTELAG
jgi:hypothetical protein